MKTISGDIHKKTANFPVHYLTLQLRVLSLGIL